MLDLRSVWFSQIIGSHIHLEIYHQLKQDIDTLKQQLETASVKERIGSRIGQ